MKPSESNPPTVEARPAGEEAMTGLPGFRTWRSLYIFVLVTFILWVVLLLALTLSYS